MRISDWSSDVCSSDLCLQAPRHGSPSIRHGRHFIRSYPSLCPTLHLEICWWRQRRYPFSLHDLSLRDAWILRTMSPIQPGMAERAATSARVPASSRRAAKRPIRSEEHTSEVQSLMRNSYAVFCLKNKKTQNTQSK